MHFIKIKYEKAVKGIALKLTIRKSTTVANVDKEDCDEEFAMLVTIKNMDVISPFEIKAKINNDFNLFLKIDKTS